LYFCYFLIIILFMYKFILLCLFYCFSFLRVLYSFPTRRSSDLWKLGTVTSEVVTYCRMSVRTRGSLLGASYLNLSKLLSRSTLTVPLSQVLRVNIQSALAFAVS